MGAWRWLAVYAALAMVGACAAPAVPGGASAPARPAAPAAAHAKAPASPAAPAPPARTALRMPYSAIGAAMTTIWIAKEGGYLADEGLDVEMDYIATSTTFTQALLGGDMQIGMGGLEGLVASVVAGADLVGLAVSTDRFVFRVYGQPGLRTLTDLRGRRLAVARHGSTSDTAARLLLRRVGLEAERDVELVPAGGNPEIYAALESGLVHGAVLGPPIGFRAEAAGYPIIADTIEDDVPFHQSVLVTTRRFVAEQEDVVRRVVRAYVRAVARFKQDKAFFKEVLGQYARIEDDDILEQSWTIQDRVLPRAPYPRLEAIQVALDRALEGRPPRLAVVADFFDERFLRELDASGFIASLYR
jgi:NitT/TauT family transport system substrate-binding protein